MPRSISSVLTTEPILPALADLDSGAEQPFDARMGYPNDFHQRLISHPKFLPVVRLRSPAVSP
jgi:hypothetical protein